MMVAWTSILLECNRNCCVNMLYFKEAYKAVLYSITLLVVTPLANCHEIVESVVGIQLF